MRAIFESDAAELKRLEKIIDKGMRTFVEVGSALKGIRDAKLYRGSHSTFEAYCKDRWKISRPRAYELIDAAEVDKNLSGIPDKKPNASQATALAKAPPDQQPEIWQEVTESTDTPTAADVKAAVERRKQPVQAEIVDDDYHEFDESEPVASPVRRRSDDQRDANPSRDHTAVERIRRLLPEAEDKFVVARDLFTTMDEWQQDQLPTLWQEWLLHRG